MQLIETIDNVNDFDVSIEELIWRSNEVLLNRKLLFEGDVVLMNSNNNLIVLQTDTAGTVIIDRNTKVKYSIEKSGPIISEELLLLGKWNQDYSARTLYAWDFKKNIQVWESESYFGKPVMINGYLFGALKSKLSRVDPSTGEPLWQLDLAENHGTYLLNGQEHYLDVQRYIGIHGGTLYIRAGNSLILGIDILNGGEVFNFQYQGEILMLDNLQLDTTKGVVFSIGSNDYFELDLPTGNAEIFSIRDEVQKHKVKLTRLGTWEDDYIYFWEGGMNRRFGVFDRSSKTIKLVGSLDEGKGDYPAIKVIKYGQDRLYVLDSKNRLHIFQQKNHLV